LRESFRAYKNFVAEAGNPESRLPGDLKSDN